jgi:hypothetical protein
LNSISQLQLLVETSGLEIALRCDTGNESDTAMHQSITHGSLLLRVLSADGIHGSGLIAVCYAIIRKAHHA